MERFTSLPAPHLPRLLIALTIVVNAQSLGAQAAKADPKVAPKELASAPAVEAPATAPATHAIRESYEGVINYAARIGFEVAAFHCGATMQDPPFATASACPISMRGMLPVVCGGISAVLLAAITLLWATSCWVDREVEWSINGTPIRLQIASAQGAFKARYVSHDEIMYRNELTYSRDPLPAGRYTVPPAIRADSNGLPAFRTVSRRPPPRFLRIGNPIGGRVRYGEISVAGWLITLAWASAWLAHSIFRRRRRVWRPAFECVAPKKRSVEPTAVRP